MSSCVFGRAAGVLVWVVLLVSGCGLVPRSQTPQEALGLPQAETPFAERVSIEEYLRSEEPVLAGFVRALAGRGVGASVSNRLGSSVIVGIGVLVRSGGGRSAVRLCMWCR